MLRCRRPTGLLLLHALRHRRPASAVLPRPRAAAAKSSSSSTATRSPKPRLFPHRQRLAQPGPQAHRLCRRHQGSEFYTRPRHRGRDRHACRYRIADTNGSFEWAADSRTLALCLARRRAPPAQGPAPCHRRRRSRRARPRAAGPRLFPGPRARRRTGASCCSASTDHETAEVSLDRRRRSLGAAAPRRAARAGARLFGRASRRPAHHPHQFRRRRGLPHRRSPGGRIPAASIGARSSRTGPAG